MNEVTPETKNKESKKKFTFLDFILIISKRWKFVFFTTIIAAFCVAAYSAISLWIPNEKSYLPNTYTATSVILFQNDNSSSNLSSMLGNNDNPLLAMAGLSNATDTNVGLVKFLLFRNSTLDSIINKLNLIETFQLTEDKHPYNTARSILSGSLSIDSESKDGTISISYTNIDPEFAEKMVIAIVDLLQEQYQNLSKDRNKESLRVIDENIAIAEKEINLKLEEFSAFQKRTGVIDPSSQIAIKSEIASRMENTIIEKRLKLEEIASYRGYQDIQVQQVQKEITQLEKALAMQIEGRGARSKYNLSLSELIKLAPEFNKIKAELEGLQSLYAGLRMQKQTKELELASNSNSFQIVEQPHYFTEYNGFKLNEPPIKSGPSRAKLCVVVTMVAFFLSLLLACILEFSKQITNDEEEKEKLKLIRNCYPHFNINCKLNKFKRNRSKKE